VNRYARIIVCGGRDYSDYAKVAAELDLLRPIVIIQGGAKGADFMARKWAEANEVFCRTFHADWDTHGKAAGPIRNQRMLDETNSNLVLAFPGGRGTADMVRRAEATGIEVRQVQP
jgi:hypothetical protein